MASETNETREKSLNFLEEIIEESIAGGETRIQTRFPPEPNGYLHIGHAKSICINFGLAKKYGGKCNLRFDDTNPVKEDVEYVDSIKRDIQWLGFQWELERYASDYFDQLYEWAVVLIKKGLAYVDDQTQDEIRENRGTVSVPGTPSPWRDRSVEENLEYLNPPVKTVFADFVSRIRLIDPDLEAALEELKGKIENDVFMEWVDALKSCLYDRSLKTTLTPIVAKLSDMRIVNAELEYLVFEPRKEFITMVVLAVGNIPLLYFLNQSWYATLMHTIPGQIMLAVTGAIIFVSTACVIKLTKPIEYRT